MDLLSLDRDALRTLVGTWGEKPFRADQIRQWIFEQGVDDFAKMTNLPKGLVARLQSDCQVGSLTVEAEQESRDGTVKRLYRLHDGQLIESVLMPYDDDRRTACISSQAGCAMGCVFCATGQMGFARQLTSGEIVEQALRLSWWLRERGERLSNIVLMGMGEPFHNYDNVVAAIRVLNGEMGIGARHITVSTVGIVPKIRQFAGEGLQVRLAISLHAANDAERGALLPINRKWPIAELIEACRYYADQTGRRISFEWALIAGKNDTRRHAEELAAVLRGLPCHVNLIPLNPTEAYDGGPTALPDASTFVGVLEAAGIPATVRVRRGIDIDAGCGQLKSKVMKRDKAASEPAS